MSEQIRKLTRVQLCNLFGLNELRYTKDKKKRRNGIAFGLVWIWILAMFVFYVLALSLGLIHLGMSALVPVYLYLLASMVILIFSFLKAGSVIFQMSTYELLASLPVSRTAIVVSRFLGMYLTDLILSFLVMLPGLVMYGVSVKPSFSFYLYGILGIFLLPLLPVTAATALGGVITAISARMRSKSLIVALLSILLAVICIVGSMRLGAGAENLDQEMLENMAELLAAQIGKLYPPAIWYGQAATAGDMGSFLLLAALSAAVFVIVVGVLQKYFMKISGLLAATTAKNNYRLKTLEKSSVLRALWKRELKRYFASSVYVTNTIIGYVMMVMMAAALLAADVEGLEQQLGMPGLTLRLLPMALSMAAILMPMTACSISMEGRQWWITLSLPIRPRDIYLSKILANLTIAAPFYAVTVLLSLIGLKPGILQALWLILVPAAYIVFGAVAGLSINLLVPVFSWENEARVVKQGASAMFSMLAGFGTVAVPVVLLFWFGEAGTDPVMLFTVLGLGALSALLFRADQQKLPGRDT